MRIGTRSLLYGSHQFLLHPCFVAYADIKLYGFSTDLSLWAGYFLHDIGYLGKPNMDGPEGERHPELGAFIVGILFGYEAGLRCLLHSRFYAKRYHRHYSRLCVSDKYAVSLMPVWLYLLLAGASGEIEEYMQLSKGAEGKYYNHSLSLTSRRDWFLDAKKYLRAWAETHKDLREDTWTNSKERISIGPLRAYK